MARFLIRGGNPITGRYRPAGNKNAALPMLAAAVLTDKPVRLRNLPLIDDVKVMLDILAELGVDISLRGHTVTLCAKGLSKRTVSRNLCRKVRSSILFSGPMAARHARVSLFPPGGDVIGRRRLDTHFDGLRKLGIDISGTDRYVFRRRNFHGADILLDEASVTATENLLMAAVLAPGRTTIFNAACEPHVQDLCRMLNSMGAEISGIGTNLLIINGVASLGGATCRISPDYVDAAGFLVAAVVTGGSLTLTEIPAEAFQVIERPLSRLSVKWERRDNSLVYNPSGPLGVRNDFGNAVPKVEDGTWPSYPSDLMSATIVLATQAHGTTLFFEKMFESRMYFVDRLIDMGARIVQCDPHRVIVSGPSTLHGTHLSSPDIRAGMALLIAALCAKGTSTIDNAQIIDRGYERVESKLRRLGADIRRVS